MAVIITVLINIGGLLTRTAVVLNLLLSNTAATKK
jgi:hypothetical protein